MKSILLVEDDPFVTEIYTAKFREAGFEVEVATNGEEALRKLKEQNPPDLLVLDIVLPQIDGFEILRKIKETSHQYGGKGLKVIILSNLSQKEEIEKGLALGATKYLIKAHYTPSEVVEEVKKILRDYE